MEDAIYVVFAAGLEGASTVVVGTLPFWWPLNWRNLTPHLEPGWRGIIQITEHRGQVACPIPQLFRARARTGARSVPRFLS